MSCLLDENIFELKRLLTNINVRLCSRSENGVKQLLALISEDSSIILHYTFGEMLPVLKHVTWFSESNKEIQSACFDPSGTWLLVVSLDSSLYIVPALSLVDQKQKIDCKWSISDLTHFPKDEKSSSAKPVQVVWWQTLDCNQNAIIGHENGDVSFVSLTDGQNIGNCSFEGCIDTLFVCQDNCLDRITLLVTNVEKQQWEMVLEQRCEGFVWLGEKNQKDHPEFGSYTPPIDETTRRSRLQGLKQLSVEKLALLKQKLVESRNRSQKAIPEDAVSTASTDSSSSQHLDQFPSEKMKRGPCLRPQYAKNRFIFSHFDKSNSLLTIYGADMSNAPFFIHKVLPDCCEIMVTDQLFFIVNEDLRTLVVISRQLSEWKPTEQKDFNEESLIGKFSLEHVDERVLAIYKRTDVMLASERNSFEKKASKQFTLPQSVQDLNVPRPKIDECVVVTNYGVYKVALSESVIEKFISLVIDKDEVEKAEKMALVFGLNWQQLLDCAGDLLLARKQFTRAFYIYQLAKCRLLKYVLKVAMTSQSSELLNFIISCLDNSGGKLSLPTKMHLSNLAVMFFTETLLRNSHNVVQKKMTLKKFNEFLCSNEQYDQVLAVNVLCQTAVWSVISTLAKARGLAPDILQVVCSILNSSHDGPRAIDLCDKELHACISEPVFLIGLLTRSQLCDVFFKFIRLNVTNFERDILKKFAEMLDLSQPVCRPLVQKLFQKRVLSRHASSSLDSTIDSIEVEFPDDLANNLKSAIDAFLHILLSYITQCKGNAFDVDLLESEPLENIQLTNFYPAQLKMRPLSAGFGHVGLIRNNRLFTWGNTTSGCLGRGPWIAKVGLVEPLTTLISLQVVIASVSCGKAHTLALTNFGIYAWGSNAYGQLGLGADVQQTPYPTLLAILSDVEVIDVSAGQYHSLALTSSGQVYSWGWGVHGQLGHCSVNNASVPKLVDRLLGMKIVQISAGHAHSLVLTATGQVYAFGSNVFGQLGNGTTTKSSIPLRVSLIEANIVMICTSYFHNLAVSSNNELYTWGASAQTLRLSQASKKAMQQQAVDNSEKDLDTSATGEENGAAKEEEINNDRAVKESSALENDLKHLFPTLVDTAELDGQIVQISTGGHHSALLTKSGTLYLWGKNLNGQIGNGSRKAVNSPTAAKVNPIIMTNMVTQLTNGNEEDLKELKCTQVSCGAEFTIAVESSGRVLGWGNNASAQLGRLPEKDNKDSGMKCFVMKSTLRVFKPPSSLNDGLDHPKEIGDLPPIEITFRSTDPRFEFNPSAACFLPWADKGPACLHFVLETYHGFYDADRLLSRCVMYNNLQAASKIAMLEGHFVDSLEFQLAALKVSMESGACPEQLVAVPSEVAGPGEARCKISPSLNSITASCSLDSIKQFGDELESQGGCESLYDDDANRLKTSTGASSGRIFTVDEFEMVNGQGPAPKEPSSEIIRKTIVSYVESIDADLLEKDRTPIPRISKLLAGLRSGEEQQQQSAGNVASDSDEQAEHFCGGRLPGNSPSDLAARILQFYINRSELAENHILMQNVLMKCMKFWFLHNLPVDVLERVLLHNVDKCFHPLSVLLFCKNFNNNHINNNMEEEKTAAAADAKQSIFLNQLSTKFCLQLCSKVLENVNKS